MNWLNILAEHHNTWLNIVRRFGETQYEEDIVQEAYVRLASTYGDRAEGICVVNGKPSHALMYFVLKNTFLLYKKNNNHTRQLKQVKTVDCEPPDVRDMFDETDKGYELFLIKLDRVINGWDDFDKKLYQLYVGTFGTQNRTYYGLKMSLRRLELETGIGINTLFRSMKRCKQEIKDKLSEDWEDFINDDYEFLK